MVNKENNKRWHWEHNTKKTIILTILLFRKKQLKVVIMNCIEMDKMKYFGEENNRFI